MATFNTQLHDEHGASLSATLEDLMQDPAFAGLHALFVQDMRLAAFLSEHKKEPLTGYFLQGVIPFLRERVMAMHPALPILTGEIPIQNPEREYPVVFKLACPKVKELNDAFSAKATNELMAQMQDLVVKFFGPSQDGGKSILTIVGRDFKGGKAILNVDALEEDAVEEIGSAFRFIVAQFQEQLEDLFRNFNVSHGSPFSEETECSMVFGVTDWSFASDPKKLVTKDFVEGFLLAEQVANMTERRGQEVRRKPLKVDSLIGKNQRQVDKRRSDAVFLSAEDYLNHLANDFRRVFGDFTKCYSDHKDDPAWNGVFMHKPVPFLSLSLIQSLRKGVASQVFPFLSNEDLVLFERFRQIVNTIDVLKPFLAEDADRFCSRLDRLAALLKEEPEEEKAQQNYVDRLAEELRISLKDRQPEGKDPVAQTRFAFAERVYDVLCKGDKDGDGATFFSGDVKQFGPLNILGLYMQLLDLLGNDSDPNRIHQLLLSAGDEMTQVLRHGEESIAKFLSIHGDTVLDAGGGDEVVGVGPSLRGQMVDPAYLSDRYYRTLRLVIAHIDPAALSCEKATDLLAALLLFGDRVLDLMKANEPLMDKIVRPPVNINVLQ